MNIAYIEKLMGELSFPKEAQVFLMNAAHSFSSSAQMKDALCCFKKSGYKNDGMEIRFKQMAELDGVSEYTVAILFMLYACEELEARYNEAGYPHSLFVDTMSDLRYKLIECKNVKGVYGNFVAGWETGFYNMTRFALGRFQYEKVLFKADFFGADGNFVQKGDTVLNFHIPSSGVPLTDEVRYDSYRKAIEFFYPNDKSPKAFVCDSWLLYPGYEEHIPSRMNIKRFRRDFALVGARSADKFDNAWRVFADKGELPPAELPRENSMQRLFADYCAEGKKHGYGYGVFFFDGEKIIK